MFIFLQDQPTNPNIWNNSGLGGSKDEVKSMSMKVGWCVNILSNIVWLKKIQKFNTVNGGWINMKIKITTNKKEDLTQDIY